MIRINCGFILWFTWTDFFFILMGVCKGSVNRFLCEHTNNIIQKCTQMSLNLIQILSFQCAITNFVRHFTGPDYNVFFYGRVCMLICWLIIQEANFTKRTFPCTQLVQVKFLAMPGLAGVFLLFFLETLRAVCYTGL